MKYKGITKDSIVALQWKATGNGSSFIKCYVELQLHYQNEIVCCTVYQMRELHDLLKIPAHFWDTASERDHIPANFQCIDIEHGHAQVVMIYDLMINEFCMLFN